MRRRDGMQPQPGADGVLAMAWLAWAKLVDGEPIAGRPLLLFALLLVVIGVQFVCTGIVTEMLARTYFEAGTARTYLVRATLGTLDAVGGERGGAGVAEAAQATEATEAAGLARQGGRPAAGDA